MNKKSIGDYILVIFTLTVGTTTLITKISENKSITGPIMLSIGAYLVIFLLLLYIIIKYRLPSRYAYNYNNLASAYSEIHSLDQSEGTLNKDIIYKSLTDVCSEISDYFTNVNGLKCSVCLKIIVEKNNMPKVFTYTRDRVSSKNRPTGKHDEIDHWVENNTDFSFISREVELSKKIESFYCKNFLPWVYNYSNTRLKDWNPKEIPVISKIIRQFSWPLPYKSTIVVPLVPYSLNKWNKDNGLRGFLCVDAPMNKVFRKKIDVSILKSLADGLYSKIDKLYEMIKE